MNFSNLEHNILNFWKQNDCFQKSLLIPESKNVFNFYDGPPFATGLPHYGHLLAGTIKDVVTRYWNQRGFYVERRFGWDCHGLPVEYEIDKRDGITHRSQVINEIGISEYNRRCREIVLRNSGEWEKTVERMGRWIDFKNDYKTMNTDFMESVWWVFSELVKKGLIYEGVKVMPFSIGCGTVVSNFEAGENYKEVSDPTIVVTFQIKNDDSYFLAWTTTPWTLLSNQALCVNPSMTYLQILCKKTNKKYILSRLESIYTEKELLKGKTHEVLNTIKGSELIGMEYIPLFNYASGDSYKVFGDDYVNSDSGTGIVHQAPAFGEDDYRVCQNNGVKNPFCPVDDNGFFTGDVGEFSGIHIHKAIPLIIENLKKKGHVVKHDVIKHQYPHCWRSNTPLIYKIVPSWFVDVPQIRDKMIENNKQIRWVPENIGSKRFKNWIEDARPWSISRSRFWGTPLPVWKSNTQTMIISSVEELQKYTTRPITDLHRDFIDDIVIISPIDGSEMRRIDAVFDCWFESGSMPYAQQHYPFENKEKFETGFPADFIAEGLDQTRGWFYTLLVISTALFDKPPFKNVIVNGLVLASNGEKMSKSKKNYEPPNEIIEKYGADAVRLTLISSPAVRAEPLAFKEELVRNITRDVLIPWYNVYLLWKDVSGIENESGCDSGNVMDKWIENLIDDLTSFINTEMEAYRLYTVLPRLIKFIDQLSKWYINFNKDRIKLGYHQTLKNVLIKLCRLMSPFAPFLSEWIYKEMTQDEGSIHYLEYPQVSMEQDSSILRKVNSLQKVIEMGRQIRESCGIRSNRFRIESVKIVSNNQEVLNDVLDLSQYLYNQLNVTNLLTGLNFDDYTEIFAYPNQKSFGKRAGKLRNFVIESIEKLTRNEIENLLENKSFQIVSSFGETFDLIPEDVKIEYKNTRKNVKCIDNIIVEINQNITNDCYEEGIAREFIFLIQRKRNQCNLKRFDKIEVKYFTPCQKLFEIIQNKFKYIEDKLKVESIKFVETLNLSEEFINLDTHLGENTNLAKIYIEF